MSVSTVVVTAILVLVQAAPKIEPPPSPDFKTKVDYAAWLEKQMTAGMGKDDNAAPLYREFLGDIDKPGTGVESLGFGGPRSDSEPNFKTGPWKSSEHRDWERACRRSEDTIAAYEKAAAKPFAFFGIRFANDVPATERTLFSTIMGELPFYRALVKGASDHAWRSDDGKPDPDRFVALMRANLGAVAQVQRDPITIAQLVAVAIRAVIYDDLGAALQHDVLPEKQRAACLAMLKSADPEIPSFRVAAYSELASTYDVAQALAARPDHSFDFNEKQGLVFGGPVKCDPAAARAGAREFYEALAKRSEEPWTSSAAEEFKQLEEQAGKKDKLLVALVPSLSRACVMRLRGEAMRRATRLLFEIHAYRDKNKKWPGGLNELAGLNDKLKTDPFSNKAFVYKKDGDGFKLYSAALNCRDDGGKHDEKWGDKTEGADYVFWPRP